MPDGPLAVTGVVQHYAWGDHEFIPRLLGVDPDGRPWAELWLGTHPNGPAALADGRPLRDLTGDLPYLLKVLAAAEPLSLQVHPDAEQAIAGQARGAFPDGRAKPELLVALTPFEALCGVRPIEATAALLHELHLSEVAGLLTEVGPGGLLEQLFLGRLDPRPLIAACSASERPEARWVRRLDDRYPGEPSVAATLLLNLVALAPGEALHLTAGNLHAYLGGAGIELMGASDNVVRGGLTVKQVDVELLLQIVDPTPLAEPVMRATGAGRYPLPEAGCELVRVEPGSAHRARGHELAIAADGAAWYLAPDTTLDPSCTTHVVVPT